MKSGRSIQDVSREILRQQEAKADYLVATDRLHMDTWGDSPVIRVLDREGIDQIEPLEIQQTAHQQIGTYLDIPSKYYDRMLQRDPALLSYNVNRWFQKEPEQKLLRTMDGKARAFLSNRYRRIDNLDIVRVGKCNQVNGKGFRVNPCALAVKERRFHRTTYLFNRHFAAHARTPSS